MTLAAFLFGICVGAFFGCISTVYAIRWALDDESSYYAGGDAVDAFHDEMTKTKKL